MRHTERSRLKRIGIDVLGVLAIAGAAATGWLPGPGGIPLLIVGLGLLATNHEWAERLLMRVKTKGGRLSETFFGSHPAIKLLIDIAGIACIGLAVLVFVKATGVVRTATVSLVLVALFLLLGNRNRLRTLRGKFTRRQKP